MGSRYGRNQRRAHREEIARLEAELHEAILARFGPLGRSKLTDVMKIPASMIAGRRLETDDSGYRYSQTLTLDLIADTDVRYMFIINNFTHGTKCVVDGVLYRARDLSVDLNYTEIGMRQIVNNPPNITLTLDGIGGGEIAKEFQNGSLHRSGPLHLGW